MTNLLLYIITVLIWGSTWFAIKVQSVYLATELSVLYRFAAAAVLLHGICLFSGKSLKISLKNHLFVMLMGLSMFSIHFLFVYEATHFLVSGVIAVIFSCVSFLSVAYNALFTRTLPRWNVTLGSVFGTLGLCIFFWDEMMRIREQAETLTGVTLSLIGTAIFALGGIISKRNQKAGLPILPTMAWGMTYGSLAVLTISLVKGIEFEFPAATDFWISLIHLIIAGSLIAYFCYMRLIENIGAELASYVTVIAPIVALFISSMMEGYTWSLYDLAGLIVVIVGNILVIKNSRKKTTALPKQ